MAKKTHRILIGLRCTKCWRQNYVTTINKLNNPEYRQFKLRKFCPQCKTHVEHKAAIKLK
jgi:ribosomal protein L33